MAGEQAQETPAQDGHADGKPEGETPLDFDAWLAKQDEPTKALLDTHTRGLKSSLTEERTERKNLEKQLRELSRQATDGSDLQKQIEAMAEAQAATNRKAAFYEGAPADVTNLKLAWVAANEFGVFDRHGEADWKRLRDAAPELFRRAVTPTGHAGNGAGQTGRGQPSMNDLIRRAAGRGG